MLENPVATDTLDQLYGEHLRTLMQRTDRALAALGFDAMVVHAGCPPTQFLDDQDYPYKVNPHFKAWVPIVDNPGCVLLYVPGGRPRVLFFRPRDYWHRPADLPGEAWTAEVDLTPVESAAEAAAQWTALRDAAPGRPTPRRTAFIGNPGAFASEAPAAVNPPELLLRLHYERAVKTRYEIECMRRASILGAKGHLAALGAFRSGASEYGAHMRYLEACAQREEELPYNNVVAYNEHAAVLHYQHLDRAPAAARRSFLLDAGAQFRGYASDITRSYAAAPGAFADLIAGVDETQQALCGEIVPGRDYRDVHLTAHRMLGDLLQRCGLTKLPGQAALELGVTGVFFPHGVGHLLGLQVHDVGGVLADPKGQERKRPEGHPYLRLTRMLEPGVVVTVEPGIYFIDTLLAAAKADARRRHIDWARVDAMRPFGGIRIEDNVVATATAPENLTRDAFARLAA
jgi:Xaa-Pro dipeptidase